MRCAVPVALIACAIAAAPAASTSLGVRTFVVSVGVNGAEPNGGSTRPSISVAGGLVAFESTASNLALDPNGRVADVFARDVIGGSTRLVSEGLGGEGANGPSGNAAVGGRVIAFHSDASNLVATDNNGLRDVFARSGTDPVVRVSQPSAGGDADGPSGQPDVSDDGRRVVFSSVASNLVPGDTNGVQDVFVRDLRTGEVTRLSDPEEGEADGLSGAPAISPDGNHVTFYSQATNLVPDDTNDGGDVFIADIGGGIERVSVATNGRQQNAAVVEPFLQISDVSDGGRFVVFDSDATNLVRRDRNDDTDVFVRDFRRGTTRRVSVNLFGQEGDNDSFFPSMTPDGRYVAFQSFAGNLAPGGAPREDIIVSDWRRRLPVVASVGSRGQRRGPEHVRQLLQRPALNREGHLVVFTSTAGNLADGDGRGFEDVFLRIASAPEVRRIIRPRRTGESRRPRLRVDVDDRRAEELMCIIDRRFRFPCRDGMLLPPMRRGRHRIEVRAGGRGMLYERRGRKRSFFLG